MWSCQTSHVLISFALNRDNNTHPTELTGGLTPVKPLSTLCVSGTQGMVGKWSWWTYVLSSVAHPLADIGMDSVLQFTSVCLWVRGWWVTEHVQFKFQHWQQVTFWKAGTVYTHANSVSAFWRITRLCNALLFLVPLLLRENEWLAICLTQEKASHPTPPWGPAWNSSIRETQMRCPK